MKIYYNSAGNNSLMLLNIPPNKDGLLAKSDVKRLKEMGKWKKQSTQTAGYQIQYSTSSQFVTNTPYVSPFPTKPKALREHSTYWFVAASIAVKQALNSEV